MSKDASYAISQIRSAVKQADSYGYDLRNLWSVIDDPVALLREVARLEDFLEMHRSKKANRFGLEIKSIRRTLEDLYQ